MGWIHIEFEDGRPLTGGILEFKTQMQDEGEWGGPLNPEKIVEDDKRDAAEDFEDRNLGNDIR